MKSCSFRIAFIVAFCLIHVKANYDCPKSGHPFDIDTYCSHFGVTEYDDCTSACRIVTTPSQQLIQVNCPNVKGYDASLWIYCVLEADGRSCTNRCYRPITFVETLLSVPVDPARRANGPPSVPSNIAIRPLPPFIATRQTQM